MGGMEVYGWIETTSGGNVWESVFSVSSVIDSRSDPFNEALIGSEGDAPPIFEDRGLPPDVFEHHSEAWRRVHYCLEEYASGHTWFTWKELEEELAEEQPLEAKAYSSDPEYLAKLVAARKRRREALHVGDWAMLTEQLAPYLKLHGPDNVRAVVWFIHSSA